MKNIKRLMNSILTMLMFIGILSTTHGQSLPSNVAKIAKGIYSYSPDGNYYSMFVVTDDGVIAIESVSTEHSKGMLQAIQEVTDNPVKYLLHSHNHWDHASGGQVFMDAGAKTIAHVEAYEWMKANTGRDMALPDESWGGNRKDITLGGITIELHYLGMNHGLGMTIFLLPKEKVAYIADIVTPNRVLFSIVPDFNIKQWERSLEEVLKMDFEKAVFTHNEKSDATKIGNKEDVRQNLQFIRDIRTAIYAEFQKGTNPFMIPTTLQLPKYKDWKMYDQWLEMNVWRVLMDEWMGPFPWRPDQAYQNMSDK